MPGKPAFVTKANADARVAKTKDAAHPVKSRFGGVRLKENIFPSTTIVRQL
jgi:hypothetical protein